MKTFVPMTLFAALAATAVLAADPPSAAAIAAGQWVTTVDDGNYARSWSEAGALFKNRLTQDEWARQIAKARGPLGQVVNRAFRGENRTTTLPGEPDGDYDIVSFATELTHKKAAMETVDDGNYARSWSEAGALFKNRLTSDEWTHQVAKARGPLGQVVNRAFRGENRTSTLPGEPDGDYDIVSFATELTHKKAAVETVILAREGDGWKVDGYFIR